jgi:transcriptional regulator GlxA family with amidase domain
MLFGIFIYPGVEPIDLATFGVLSMARRIAPEIEICTIAPEAGSIELANGLRVTADFGIDDAPPCALVIVTGGPGWSTQSMRPATLDYVRPRPRQRAHRFGLHRRHDSGGKRNPRRRSRHHQTRSGAAGDRAA